MRLISWLKRRKGLKSTRPVNVKTILNFLEAEFQFWRSTSSFLEAPPHIEEQSIWRLQQIKEKSPSCLITSGYCFNCGDLGHLNEKCTACPKGVYTDEPDLRCRHCGCNTIEKTFEQGACEGGCYPSRLDKESWEQFKQIHNVEFTEKRI